MSTDHSDRAPRVTGAAASQPQRTLARRPHSPPRWLFILLAGALPLLALGALELVLRAAGWGYPTDFLISGKVQGQARWVTNWQFGWRFFPRWLSPIPHPVSAPLHKEARTRRIFVFGESAAMGFPAPEYGFSRMLESLLQHRFPGEKFEVINVAMVAINSNAVLPIARECARKAGDLWIVYMGNNEVIGPFGAQGLFGGKAPPMPVIRANLAARRLRLWQLVESVQAWFHERQDLPPQWKGMQMWKGRIRRADPAVLRVAEYFAENLKDIVRAAQTAGVPTLVCTLPCNLRDCSPFASVHQVGLSQVEVANWQAAFEAGSKEQAAGEYTRAASFYTNAARIDPHYAELQFRLGECALSLGHSFEAREHLEQAKDEDALQFRPDSRLNQVIREISAGHYPFPVRLLDAEAFFAANSPSGIPGHELFYEHVHLTPAANYLLARAAAEAAAALLVEEKVSGPARSAGDWLDESACQKSIGLTDWGRAQALETVRRLFQDPPFTTQSVQTQRLAAVDAELRRLRPALHPTGLHRSTQLVLDALQSRPRDPELHHVLAALLESDGANVRAEQEWRATISLQPFAAVPYLNLGQLLSSSGREDEAITCFVDCLRHDYFNAQAQGEVGMLLLKQNRAADALPHLREVVRQQPDSVSGHFFLGRAYLAMRRRSFALREFQRVLVLDPTHAEAQAYLRQLSNDRP